MDVSTWFTLCPEQSHLKKLLTTRMKIRAASSQLVSPLRYLLPSYNRIEKRLKALRMRRLPIAKGINDDRALKFPSQEHFRSGRKREIGLIRWPTILQWQRDHLMAYLKCQRSSIVGADNTTIGCN